MPKNIVIWGVTGTGKTSLALNSKRPKFMAEWDIGSFERAKANRNLVDLHQYVSPFTVLEDFGFLDTSMVGSGRGPTRIQHKLTGWLDVYSNFMRESLDFFKNEPPNHYCVVDTTKPEWEAANNAMGERIQTDPRFKNMDPKALKTAEYAEPNNQQAAFIHIAKSTGHDLVWVGHAREIWDAAENQYTGKWKLDGWKHLEDQADIVLETSVRGRRPVATVRKGPFDLRNWEFSDMSLDDIVELFTAAKAVVDADMPLPQDGEYADRVAQVLQMASMV